VHDNKTNHAIRWIVIYPVGSVIHQLNNLGLKFNPKTQDPFVALVSAAFSFLRVAEALNAGKKWKTEKLTVRLD